MGALYAPRAPIERPKSGSYDYPDDYSKMVYWRDAVLRQGAEELQACNDLQRANDYNGYLNGAYWDADRPEFRSKYSDNVLMDQRLEAIAALSDIRPTIDISCSVEEYKAQAEIVLNVFRSVWQTQRIQSHQLRDWIDHAL